MKLSILFATALLLLSLSACKTIPTPLYLSDRLNTEGTDFWVCFEKNYRTSSNNDKKQSDTLVLQLTLAASSAATVTIETAIGTQTIQLRKGEIARVTVDTALQVTSSGKVEKQAIHITSTYPISVRGSNSRYQTTDAFTAIPYQHLGKEYRVIGFDKLSDDLLSQFAVVATEDATFVTITPQVDTWNKQKAGIPFTISLNKGEVYQVISCVSSKDCDITGTLVQANKPVAVFSGHNCAYVPYSIPACNHLVEQILPLQYWGKYYGIGTLGQRSISTFRIVANEPNTRVVINNTKIVTLGAGEHYTDNEQKSTVWLFADKPIMVAQYGQGFRNGDSVGDATMLLIRPVEQFQTAYSIVPPLEGSWNNFINIIITENGLHSLRLDGQPVNTAVFIPCGAPPYLIGTIAVSGTAPHALTAAEPFGVYCYGFGNGEKGYDAYGNM